MRVSSETLSVPASYCDLFLAVYLLYRKSFRIVLRGEVGDFDFNFAWVFYVRLFGALLIMYNILQAFVFKTLHLEY